MMLVFLVVVVDDHVDVYMRVSWYGMIRQGVRYDMKVWYDMISR